MKVLVVEDNEMNRDMIGRRLTRAGHDVSFAFDGQEGLDKVHALRPDIVLMDMNLPVLDGWEATRMLKEADDTRCIPIIALTAHALSDERDRAMAAGCDDYVSKPVDFPTLTAAMGRLCPATTQP